MRFSSSLRLGLSICVLACASVQAQTPAPKEIAVHAGRLIDVRNGQVTKDAYIVIQGKRIKAISTSAPSGDTVIDMSRFTIVPGLIDCLRTSFRTRQRSRKANT